MLSQESIQLLQLSENERKLFAVLCDGEAKPTKAVRKSKIPRASAYLAFTQLKDRGLVKILKLENKRYWALDGRCDPFKEIESLQKIYRRDHSSDAENVPITSATGVIIHKGKKALVELIGNLNNSLKGKRCGSFQSDRTKAGWLRVIGEKKIIKFNELVKKNNIIEERVLPERYFKNIKAALGKKWLESYLGQTTMTVKLPDRYFDSDSEMWVYEDKVLLLNMEGELAVEIRHPSMAELLRSVFRFMQDNGRKVRVDEDDLVHEDEPTGVTTMPFTSRSPTHSPTPIL